MGPGEGIDEGLTFSTETGLRHFDARYKRLYKL